MKIVMLLVMMLILSLALGCSSPQVPVQPEVKPGAVQPEVKPPGVKPEVEPPLEPGGEHVLTPDEENTFQIWATGYDLEFYAKNLPPGSTFNPETRAFSWMPEIGQAGVYPGVGFFVTNGEFTDFEFINIIVVSANHPPVMSSVPLKVANIGDLLTFTLQASDPDGDELEFYASNLPPGAQFSSPSFSWIPEEAGVWPAISFTVTDGKVKDTRQVIIAVLIDAE